MLVGLEIPNLSQTLSLSKPDFELEVSSRMSVVLIYCHYCKHKCSDCLKITLKMILLKVLVHIKILLTSFLKQLFRTQGFWEARCQLTSSNFWEARFFDKLLDIAPTDFFLDLQMKYDSGFWEGILQKGEGECS